MSGRASFVLALLCAAAGAAQAQAVGSKVQYSYDLRGDSVLAVESGATVSFDLYAYDGFGYGVDSFALRVPFDAAKLAFVSADRRCPDSTTLNVSPGAGFVVVSSPSCGAYPYSQVVARLTFRLLAGVTDGTIIGMDPLATIDNGGFDRQLDMSTDFAQICHASGTWGDIDGDAAVNSRDALIALSNAVGIPTGAFNVTRGDVDADGQVTSRDALGILSGSIGLPVGGFRVGLGIADACAPQPVFPRPLYFSRSGATPGVPGLSGLAIRAANDSTVTIPGDSADTQLSYTWRPRVSPDGSSVLFVCLSPSFYPRVCKANADGSGSTPLTPDFFIAQSPDWSPAGDSIVFVVNNQLFIMGADGSGQRGVTGPTNVSSVAWSPTGRVLAYTRAGGAGTVNTFDLSTGGDATVFFPTLPGSSSPARVDWTAAGDSLVFELTMAFNPTIVSVPAAGGSLTLRYSLTSATMQPAWTDRGVLFVTYYAGYYRILLGKPDGTYAIVSHDNQMHQAPGMRRQ